MHFGTWLSMVVLLVHHAHSKLTDGYKIVPEIGAYKFHLDPMNWHNAWRTCNDEIAFLVVINNEKEADAIRIVLEPLKELVDEPGYFLIGYHTLFTFQYWTTLFGTPIDTLYNRWALGHPLEMGAEKCGAIDSRGELISVTCTENEYPFICEKNMRHFKSTATNHTLTKNVGVPKL